MAAKARRQPVPRDGAAAGRQVQVEPQGVELRRRLAPAPCAQVVVQVEEHGVVERRFDQLHRIGPAQAGDHVGVADVEADAEGGGADPVRHRAQHAGREGEDVGTGEDRCEVLDRDHDAQALGHLGGDRERASLGEQLVLARGPVEKVGRVVDDVAGTGLGGVGEQALHRAVPLRGAHLQRSRSVQHSLQAGGTERSAETAGVPGRGARVHEHRRRGRGNLNPAEAGGLDLLQRGGRRPPFVGDAESEAGVERRLLHGREGTGGAGRFREELVKGRARTAVSATTANIRLEI